MGFSHLLFSITSYRFSPKPISVFLTLSFSRFLISEDTCIMRLFLPSELLEIFVGAVIAEFHTIIFGKDTLLDLRAVFKARIVLGLDHVHGKLYFC